MYETLRLDVERILVEERLPERFQVSERRNAPYGFRDVQPFSNVVGHGSTMLFTRHHTC